jgi:hypothetical protein
MIVSMHDTMDMATAGNTPFPCNRNRSQRLKARILGACAGWRFGGEGIVIGCGGTQSPTGVI